MPYFFLCKKNIKEYKHVNKMKRNIANVTIIASSSPRKGNLDNPLITNNTILVIKLTIVSIIQLNDFITFYNKESSFWKKTL